MKSARHEQPHVVYCYQDSDTTIHSSNAYGILIVIFPFPLTAYQGIVNPKSRRLSPDRGSAVARNMLNARRTERLTGGDDRVEFGLVEPVLGGQRGFGSCVEKEVAGTVEGYEPMLTRKGGSEWVEC